MNPFKHRPARSWLKVSIIVPAAVTDTVASFLGQLSGSGTEIVDGSLPAGFAAADHETVVGYLEADASLPDKKKQLDEFLSQLNKRTPEAAPLAAEIQEIKEEDWGKSWKEHFKPARITPRLTVKPSWEPYAAAPGELVIEIDPGMAFGTGLHASTKLALMLLEEGFRQSSPAPATVLDVGTGTGILGIASGLLGARCVRGIDNDPDAVAAAATNIAANKLDHVMQADDEPLDAIQGSFDLVTANITSDVLTAMAKQLTDHLRPQGFLILAGILAGEQEDNIARTFSSLGLTCIKRLHQDEWVAFLFRKTTTRS